MCTSIHTPQVCVPPTYHACVSSIWLEQWCMCMHYMTYMHTPPHDMHAHSPTWCACTLPHMTCMCTPSQDMHAYSHTWHACTLPHMVCMYTHTHDMHLSSYMTLPMTHVHPSLDIHVYPPLYDMHVYTPYDPMMHVHPHTHRAHVYTHTHMTCMCTSFPPTHEVYHRKGEFLLRFWTEVSVQGKKFPWRMEMAKKFRN